MIILFIKEELRLLKKKLINIYMMMVNLGLLLAMQIHNIMPWALAFAAGCMIYVVAEEMIPEMVNEGHDHFGVWSFILGFVIMMALDCIQF